MNPGQIVGIDKLPANVPLAPTTPTTPVAVSAQTIPALAAEKPAPATPSKRKKKRKLSGSSSTGVDQLNVSDNVPQTPTPTKANPRSKKATAEAKAAAALAAKQQQQLQQQMYMSMPMGGDVMVVGEPGLMGGDFGEEDERLITRLENNQIEINSSHALHHQQQQHMQYQHHFNNPSRSSPIQLVNADMHSHPTRPHSLQSHLSQPNVSPSLMSLPPRPQSTSSHLLASSSVHEPTTHLQSPSTNQIDTNNSNTIMSSLINEANEIADGGSSSGTNVFNPITSASNLASSSDAMDFNEPNIGSIPTAAAPAVNQPSTSSSLSNSR